MLRLSPGRLVVFASILIVGLSTAIHFSVRSFDTDASPPALAEVRLVPITTADGRKMFLGDAIRPGLPTVINFWATWCGPCASEAPFISDLRRKFGPEQLNLVYLNVRDQGAEPEDLASYMRSFDMSTKGYAVLDDDQDIRTLTNTGTRFIPRTLIYNKNGEPLGMITGYRRLALERIEEIVADEQT
jgi:cytochrome c biogenesis protein CcmG, thiol:disulfide interchange protein DsbE